MCVCVRARSRVHCVVTNCSIVSDELTSVFHRFGRLPCVPCTYRRMRTPSAHPLCHISSCRTIGLQFGQYTVIVFICRGGSAESAFDASDVVRRVYLFCVYVRQAYHLYSGGHRNRNQLVLSAAATIDAPKTHNSQAII